MILQNKKILRNTEECIKAIQSAMPGYYEVSNTFTIPKYSYKIRNDKISIISRGLGYPEVVLRVQLHNNADNTTELVAVFNNSILQRFIIWIATTILFLGSLLYILGIILGDIPLDESPILTIGLPTLVLLVSIIYLLYTEIVRKREKQNMIILLNTILDR